MLLQFKDAPMNIIGINVASEFIGLQFFIYALACSLGDNYTENMVMATVIMFAMQHSGALFNPIVTLNLVLRRRMGLIEFSLISITQIISIFLAAVITKYMTNIVLEPTFVASNFKEYAQLFFNEALFTFILLLFINIQITKEIAFTDQPIFTGLLFFFILHTVRRGSINSGSVLNPAIGISLPLVASIFNSDYNSLHLIWVWVVAPTIGGILSYFFFEYVYLPQALKMNYVGQNRSNKIPSGIIQE